MIAAELIGVSKRFGPTAALEDVSFAVGEGEVAALLGPNGAGKTTALAVLVGLRRADRGTARLFGGDPRRAATRREVGVTPQETSFPATLRVRELIDLIRAHFARPLPSEHVLARFELGRIADRQLGGLSGGERRRVGVALAFAGDPRLVVLDEPTTGLDRNARSAVWDSIAAHAEGGGAILLTTHHLEEAEALAQRVILFEQGRVAGDGPLHEIRAAAGLAVIRFRAGSDVSVPGAVRDGAFVKILTGEPGETVAELVRNGHRLDELEVRAVSLEEALAAGVPRRPEVVGR